MNLSLIKIRSIFPYFNEQPITADECLKIISREKIIFRQLPLMVDGYYTHRNGQHFILVNSRLNGIQWLHTVLHELHHYLFDVPGENENYTFYRNGRFVDRREYRADAFALIGVMPWPELMRVSADDVAASPWLGEIVRDRIVVRTHFGL